jgi:transposase-like protein
MSESRKYQKFTKEFKLEAVKMVIDHGHKQSEVSRNLGVSANLLGRWVAQFKEENDQAFPGNGNLKPEDQRVKDLEAQVRRLTMERDILKKAMAYFAEVPK